MRYNELINNSSKLKLLRVKWVQPLDGTVHCINCGSNENIRWHHVVPIGNGGLDVPSNIVPVCSNCHYKIHSAPTLNDYLAKARESRKSFGGRKRNIPNDYRRHLSDYVFCRIGKSELKAILGIKANDITDRVWYREYLDENNIANVRNNIDIIRSHRPLREGEKVGYITWKTGNTQSFYARGGQKA